MATQVVLLALLHLQSIFKGQDKLNVLQIWAPHVPRETKTQISRDLRMLKSSEGLVEGAPRHNTEIDTSGIHKEVVHNQKCKTNTPTCIMS